MTGSRASPRNCLRSEFRRAKNELKSTFESHLHELEREARLDDTSYSPSDHHSPARYPHAYDDYKYDSAEPSFSESQPPTLDSPATEQSEAQIESPAPNVAPADTVPRNNGVQPVSVANQDERSA
jgi:hypothetical protein